MRAIQVLAIIGLVAAPMGAHAGLLTNGDFAAPLVSGSFNTYSDSSAAITGWSVTGNSVDLIGTYWQAPPSGGQSVDLDGNAPGGLTQTLSTIAGTKYGISFYLSGNPDGSPAIKSLDVSAGSSSANYTYAIGLNSHEDMMYAPETFLFTATGASTTLSFTSLDTNSPYGPVIGGVTGHALAVPEPVSLAILGTGLISLGVVRRRRRRH